MKIFNTLPLLALMLIFGCKQEIDRKTLVLDSLRKAYADKPVHITLRNNPSGTAPITSQYAYTDINKTDLALKRKTRININLIMKRVMILYQHYSIQTEF